MYIKGLIDIPLKPRERGYISLQCGFLCLNFWPWALFIVNRRKVNKLKRLEGIIPLILKQTAAFGQINHTLNSIDYIGVYYNRITSSDTNLQCGYQKPDKVISTRGFYVIYNVCCQKLCLGKKDGKKDEGMSQSKRNIEIRSIYLNCYLLLNICFYLDCLLFYHPFFDRTLWLRLYSKR